VSAKLGGLDGITTFCEMAVPLAARLAEKLGLPGNTPESVDAARDKVGGGSGGVRGFWRVKGCRGEAARWQGRRGQEAGPAGRGLAACL
jgi:hypothetical protein